MGTAPSSTNDALQVRHQLHIDALKAGELETLVTLFCDDAVLMAPNETTLYGKAEVREWFEDYFEHFRITTMAVTERKVTLLDGWAVERVAYSIAISPIKGGDRIRDDSRWLAMWKLDVDGAWRISQFMFNSIRPIGSGTSRFMSRLSQRRSNDA